MTSDTHECKKRFCEIFKENREVGHLCYMGLLKDVLRMNGNKVLYAVYDFETTQNSSYSDKTEGHVSYLVCVQQVYARCEDVEACGDCV